MKVFLAGTNCLKKNIEECKKIPFILESFYTIKEWQVPIIKQCEMFLLDSGAFTFMNSFKGQVNWQEYIDKYADFIVRNDIKYFFELDIDSIVGYDKVKEYTTYLENKTKRKCIPVWHKSRGIEEWKRITKKYDYVAIGGMVIKEITPKEYKYFRPLLKIAKENNCKVHGLGFTGMKHLTKYPFYSVDSTSWTAGSRFGVIYQFKNKKIEQISKPKNSRIRKEKEEECKLTNLKEWIKFQDYANKYL